MSNAQCARKFISISIRIPQPYIRGGLVLKNFPEFSISICVILIIPSSSQLDGHEVVFVALRVAPLIWHMIDPVPVPFQLPSNHTTTQSPSNYLC